MNRIADCLYALNVGLTESQDKNAVQVNNNNKNIMQRNSETNAIRLLPKSDANQFILKILNDSSAIELTINQWESNKVIFLVEKNFALIACK